MQIQTIIFAKFVKTFYGNQHNAINASHYIAYNVQHNGFKKNINAPVVGKEQKLKELIKMLKIIQRSYNLNVLTNKKDVNNLLITLIYRNIMKNVSTK